MKAWHFTKGNMLRDGTPAPPPGTTLRYTGPLPVRLCERGLHFSLKPHQALKYAPGCTLHLVEVPDNALLEDDKGVAVERTIIASMDATELLQFHARMCALSVAHLWEPPDVVLDFLMTGDNATEATEAVRAAARAAAAAWAAAAAAAAAAAGTAAWAAAAAGTAARAAAEATAAWAAAEATAGAARATAWAAWAAWAATRTAWSAALNADFDALVYECFKEYL